VLFDHPGHGVAIDIADDNDRHQIGAVPIVPA
jgi:hypothetical protein